MSASKSTYLQYRISCRDCNYTRYFGMAYLTAHVKGTSHALRLMHTVDIVAIDLEKLEVTVSETVAPKVTQETCNDTPF